MDIGRQAVFGMRNGTRALERFLESVEKRAFRMAQIAVGNSDDALDIVQDAMLALVRRYGTKPEAELKPLFYRILINRIRDGHRRRTIRHRWRTWLQPVVKEHPGPGADPIEQLPDPSEHSPADHTLMADSMNAIDAAVRALPLRQQQAFLLRAWEELSVDETAAVMSCSAGSVKTHYARAVRALRETLEEYRP